MEQAPNMDFVTPWLAVGGDLDEDDDVALAQLAGIVDAGITHIIDCRIEWSDEELVKDLAPHIEYLHHGVDDAGQAIPDRWFDDGIAFVEAALQDPDARVLAHCHMGINRGPSMGYAILMAAGWDPIAALDAIRSARSIAAVGYAEDALDHHNRRRGASDTAAAAQRRRLREWRRDNDIDVATIIRGIRAAEDQRRQAG